MFTSTAITTRRVPALDGLRGLAVVGVLLFHGGFGWARGGFLGVSMFFTLSGFLITGLLVDEHARCGRIDLGRFWGRRLRRLLPAAFLALAGTIVFAVTVADGDQVRALRGDALAALGYVANWRFILAGRSYGDLFGAPSPVQHFWSLAIEEQYYAVFPLVVTSSLRFDSGRRRILVAVCGAGTVASVVASIVLFDAADTSRAYFGTDTRAAEILVGALAALWWRRAGPRVRLPAAVQMAGVVALAAVLVAWAATTTGDAWLYRGGFVALALAAAVVIMAAHGEGPLARLLSVSPLRSIGLLSYGLYLYHWPVFLWLTASRTGLTIGPLFLLRVTVTFALAVGSFVLVERPVQARRLVRRRAGLLVGPAAVALAAAVVLVTASPPPSTFDLAQGPSVERPRSVPPAGVAPVRVLVVGDSLAGVLAEGLARWGRQEDRLVVWNTSVAGCGIVRSGEIVFNDHVERVNPGCDEWPERWRTDVASFRPDVVLVHSGPWDIANRRLAGWPRFLELGDPTFDDHLVDDYQAAATLLSDASVPVRWLTSPCFDPLVERQDKMYDDAAVARLGRVLLPRAVAHVPGVRIIDLYAKVCPGDSYTHHLGGRTGTRPDGVHFIPPTADWLAEWLGPQLLEGARPSS